MTVEIESAPIEQLDTVAFLSNPASYGLNHPVEIHETHGSRVFLAGDHAYKLKRAVKLPYLDYSTPQRRREMCARELAVNRAMAPDLYEAVRGIVRENGALRFSDADDPRAIEWVVVMRRFHQSDLLEARRKAGALTLLDLSALADAVANFHRGARISRDFGGASGIRAVTDENTAILRAVGSSGVCSPAVIEDYTQLSEAWLRRLRHILGWRRRGGYVRRCHGDLHLNNVAMIAGKAVLFDAIEFDESFATIDVLFDLAFLLMDLDSHGLRAHANALLNRYLEQTYDYGGLAALPLFLSCRAALRAHVAIAARAAHASDCPNKAEPANLLDAAVDYLGPRKPVLVAVGGLSGTGKTTLARLLAPGIGAAPGAVVLRSDVIRKKLLGTAEETRLGDDAYDARTNAAVYAKLCELAGTTLQGGHSVIADAVFGDEAERVQMAAVAHSASVEFHGIWLEAPRRILEQRIASRTADASDATVEVLGKQIAHIAEPCNWRRVSANGSPAEVVARAGLAIGLAPEIAI